MMNRMKNMVHRNFTAKLMALVIAVVLWVMVMDGQNPTVDKEYILPISLENHPRGYKITQGTESAKVKVRAQRSYFVNIGSGDFKARADLSGLGGGSSNVPLQVQMPQGFELLEVVPENVDVYLDPYVEKQIRVDLIVTGSTAPNTTIAEINQDYRAVTVIGPKSAVDGVSRVIGYVGLTGNDSDFDLQVPLSAIDEDGHEIPEVRVVPFATEVHVLLARGLSKSVVSVKPMLENDLPAGYVVDAVRASPSNIEIAGDEKLIGSIHTIETEKISLKDKVKTFTVPVNLVVPEGITVTNSEASVNIVINKKK